MTNKFSKAQLQKAYKKAFDNYINRSDVTGVDIGYKYTNGKRTDDIVVRIHVKEKIPITALESASVFPEEIEGVPTDIIQAIYKPSIVTKESLIQRRRRQGIIQPGLSISHPNVSAGTLGAIVYDNQTNRPCILSNWHVLVGSSNASPGDDIIQPGFADGGSSPQDKVGELGRSILNAEGDAAIAFLDVNSRSSLDPSQLETRVLVESARRAEIGDILEKSGRTTGVTRGRVDGFGGYTIRYPVGDVTIQGFKIVSVKDGNPDNEEISSGGDSGSLWYDSETSEGVGLHFAGEVSVDPRAEEAIACHLPNVLTALDVSLTPSANLGDIQLVSPEAVITSLQQVIDQKLVIPYGDLNTSPLAKNKALCEEIQEILKDKFYFFKVDGLYGRRTRQALRDFKDALSITGGDLLGATTAKLLLDFKGKEKSGRCPFAKWTPISGSIGKYKGGPFKIVHHTTEGSTAAGAMAAYKKNKSDPHFTVDSTTIYQHINTNEGARSLRNLSGGVQTNFDSAIQIEVVGFAGDHDKNKDTLRNVAKLCRWLEKTYDIPQVWPNGFPRAAKRDGGGDPGGHNRNSKNWDNEGGHYGHSQVPENTHWDPGYTREQLAIVMGGVLRTLETIGIETVSAESVPSPEIEVEIDNLNLVTLPVTIELNKNGQGDLPLDIAWERITSVIPLAVKNDKGLWESCTVSLAEQEGQTFLVVTNGQPNSTVTVLVKVLESKLLSAEAESSGCPIDHDSLEHFHDQEMETIDNETPIVFEDLECVATHEDEDEDEEAFALEADPFPAVNTQLPSSGTGFYSYSKFRWKQFGRVETIRAIESICNDWFLNHRTGPLIGIGNISVKGGGPVSPHKGHRRGVEVDIRPLRSDGAKVPTRWQERAYSSSRTQELINTIRANSVLPVDVIFFNDPGVIGVTPLAGHDNHLHVRFIV